jgi:hypothetical protein
MPRMKHWYMCAVSMSVAADDLVLHTKAAMSVAGCLVLHQEVIRQLPGRFIYEHGPFVVNESDYSQLNLRDYPHTRASYQ